MLQVRRLPHTDGGKAGRPSRKEVRIIKVSRTSNFVFLQYNTYTCALFEYYGFVSRCRFCKEPVDLQTHLCSTQETNLAEMTPVDGKFREIIYDVETYTDPESGVFIPFAVVALRRCENCCQTWDMDLKNCDTCGQREQ